MLWWWTRLHIHNCVILYWVLYSFVRWSLVRFLRPPVGFKAVFLRFFAYCVKASIRVTRKVQEPLKPPLLAISSISKNWLSDIERFILLRLLIVVNRQSHVCQFLPGLCKRKFQFPRCCALTLARWYTSYRFALYYIPGASH